MNRTLLVRWVIAAASTACAAPLVVRRDASQQRPPEAFGAGVANARDDTPRSAGSMQLDTEAALVAALDACARRDAAACDGLCARGQLSGCLLLGTLYTEGIGVPRDPARARALYERACDGGEPLAC